ncbi:DUF3192 domain-containing protein [Alteromonas pelagimontana]|uniref:DUF3192 domain-containing protein n=1 Tax=Alteromonas pelagimontana TaxID=1858656 RepID=A0A6M4MLD0_9ALTE|nr:DUF3192 domain-containing protein [Alteromonas pelagimontana]QJR82876.1 DUF3192 domain-containing protein [Alteromonas pelagimontana]
MKHCVLILALLAPIALSGCVISVGGDEGNYSSDWEDREFNNRQHISKLQEDMSYESVVQKMGVADFNELHQKEDGVYRILFYRTQRTMDDGVTTKDECTPLVFKNGSLVGWGDSAYARI